MRNNFIYLLIIFSILSTNLIASTNESLLKDKSSVSMGKKKWMKRSKANSRYKSGDYNGALRIYRDIYNENAGDASLNFLIGRCYVRLNEMNDALKYLTTAEEIQPDVNKMLHFHKGEAYLYLGNIDSAIIEFNTYKSTLKGASLNNDPVFELVAQAETAKQLMESPVNITIKNMGTDINSQFDDGMPAISADGKTLIFTSRRSDTKGGGIDPNTGQYYDDIYVAEWDDETAKWNISTEAEGSINTPGHDAILGISPDGNTIFVYRNIIKVTGSGDIYYSTKRADGKWGGTRALPKPINSSYFEGSCSLSPDGNTLYFVSENKKGYGNADIWKSKRINKTEWAEPENLGPIINSEADEMSVFMHPDGKTLFFASNGHKTMGGYDVFMTQLKQNGTWTEPVNLGYPINTSKNELTFTITADGKKAYITSTKDNGFGGADIYEIDMRKYEYPIKIEGIEPEAEPALSILKGNVLESNSAQKLEAEILIKDLESGTSTKIFTNENGDYFVTLTGDKEYEISVEKEGYKKYSESIKLSYDKEKTFTLFKIIVLQANPTKENK